MPPAVLFRVDRDTQEEFGVCKTMCDVVRQYRTEIPPESLVIGRYSVLPWYGELEAELALRGSKLINSYAQHQWIADVLAWSGDGYLGFPGILDGLTAQSWSAWAQLPNNMSFVVKGRTNSRKMKWNTHMFAPSRDDVPTIAGRLLEDALVSEQGLVVREYMPLRMFETGLNGLPITNEWRCFFWGTRLLAKGFYWANVPEVFDRAEWTLEAEQLVFTAAERCAEFANFFVLDVAQREDGGWVIIEVNDGQMSGLSLVDPQELYSALNTMK